MATVEEWLKSIKLERYLEVFSNQGFDLAVCVLTYSTDAHACAGALKKTVVSICQFLSLDR